MNLKIDPKTNTSSLIISTKEAELLCHSAFKKEKAEQIRLGLGAATLINIAKSYVKSRAGYGYQKIEVC